MRSAAIIAGGAVAAVLGAACAQHNVLTKGAEDDAALSPTIAMTPHALRLGAPFTVALTEQAWVHAFHFALSAPATLDVATAAAASGDEVDTVVYLLAGAAGGTILARSDDISQRDRFSRLNDVQLGPGRYRIVVKGYARTTRGPFELDTACRGDGCRRAEVGAERCAFGRRFDRFVDAHTFDTLRRSRLSTIDTLSPTERAQLVRAAQEALGDAATAETALWAADGDEVVVTERRSRHDGRDYIAFDYAAGGVRFGGIFSAGDPLPAALIDDGRIHQCAVDAGPGAADGNDCADTSDCRVGLSCVGIAADRGIGRCAVAGELDGAGHTCREDGDCAEHLVCAGTSANDNGSCVSYWMRSSFTADNRGDIPDAGTLQSSFHVYGLGRVAVDVVPNIIIFHDRPGELRVVLSDPSGAEVVLFDGDDDDEPFAPGPLHVHAPVELHTAGGVNGTWTLHVQDTATRHTGDLRNATLTITSRDVTAVRVLTPR